MLCLLAHVLPYLLLSLSFHRGCWFDFPMLKFCFFGSLGVTLLVFAGGGLDRLQWRTGT